MGELIAIPAAAPAFYFDLASPFGYLAAERVDRLFSGAVWRPAWLPSAAGPDDAVRAAAERRAAALRMPLVWPEAFSQDGRAAMRAAAYALECGRAPGFALAIGRLAFCGGYDVDDPEVLVEAAAAAGLDLAGCLHAAGDAARDGAIAAAGRRLDAMGADVLPAVHVGRTLFVGEERLPEAVAAARAAHLRPASRRTPVAG